MFCSVIRMVCVNAYKIKQILFEIVIYCARFMYFGNYTTYFI